MHGYKSLYEGDLNENDDFNEWSQSRLVNNILHAAILTKMTILATGN